MKKEAAELEKHRLRLQASLDADKTQAERNRMGQFATPVDLALDILRYAKAQMGDNAKVRFIDPAVGTGSFYSALLSVFSKIRIKYAVGYEIDPYYGVPAKELWKEAGLDIHLEDFTRTEPPEGAKKFNLLVCNPPYVRHHHIANIEKQRLKTRTRETCGVKVSGLSGLYCYFLGLCHAWMEDGALAGWLIPSEFMDVNYGVSVKRYLLREVTLLHVHRFDPNQVQFGDALVSSVVVWFRKEKPPRDHEVRFTYGGLLQRPKLDRPVSVETLSRDPKWTRYPMKKVKKDENEKDLSILADFFKIKRGLATGHNHYFILSAEEVKRRDFPIDAFRPILPSPRYLPEDEVTADSRGNPILERRLFLLDCPLGEDEIGKRYPKLWAYLVEGKARGIDQCYLCQHRTPWYSQENRLPAPFLCTYIGRSNTKSGRPFRFILNHSKATAANVYLMLYPKNPLDRALKGNPALRRQVWEFLNQICPKAMLDEGRVYGGGLHKLEPKELGNVPAATIAKLLPESTRSPLGKQSELFEAEVA